MSWKSASKLPPRPYKSWQEYAAKCPDAPRVATTAPERTPEEIRRALYGLR